METSLEVLSFERPSISDNRPVRPLTFSVRAAENRTIPLYSKARVPTRIVKRAEGRHCRGCAATEFSRHLVPSFIVPVSV